MNLYIDIDNTICNTGDSVDKYNNATPIIDRIQHINNLYDNGYTITYWTARGNTSKVDYNELTVKQLKEWGCKYHHLKMNKPSFDLFIDDKCCHSESYFTSQQKYKPEIIEKGWGHEVIFVNNEKYCGKILHFKKNSKFSMHYHIKKTETWFVSSGTFTFLSIDTSNATVISQILQKGDVITNKIGQPHQIICEEEGDIFEVSTQHFDSDSYRVFKGDSQL